MFDRSHQTYYTWVMSDGSSCKICVVCGRPNKVRGTKCNTCYVKVRRYRLKLAAIELLGGKCKRCGWSGNPVAFDFHHTGSKDFTIASVGTISWKRVRKEVVKCVLLCAICHRIEHSDSNPELMAAILDYKGPLKEHAGPGSLIRTIPKNGRESFDRKTPIRNVKGSWPSTEDLQRMVLESPVTRVSKIIGVSGSAIKKRCKTLGLETRPRGYWTTGFGTTASVA